MRLGSKQTLIDRAQDYAESVAGTVWPHLETVKPHLEAARDQATVAARDAAEKAGPALADARERAVPVINDARERAKPLIAEGRVRAAEAAAVGASLASEKAAAGAALASEKAAAGRDLAAARVAELSSEPEPRKGSLLKKLLLVGGLAAVGGVVYSKLKGQSESANWQSTYTPTPPPPSPSTSTGTAAADDSAGGSPGEAITDGQATPHATTTPDQPAEVVDIEQGPDTSKA